MAAEGAAPSVRESVKARLRELGAGLLHHATLRRREKRLTGYLLRLFVIAMLTAVVALKVVQLGPIGALLAFVKVGVAAALVVGALAAVFAAQEWLKRRAAS